MTMHHTRSAGWGRVALVSGLLQLWAPRARAEEPPPRPLAQEAKLTCLGSSRAVFRPALGPTSQNGSMSLSSRYSGCLSLSGQGVSSATVTSLVVPFSQYTCLDALGSAPERVTVTWNTGETSVLSLQAAELDEERTTTTVNYVGEVVEGKFLGLTVVRSFTYLNSDFTTRCQSATGLPETNAFSLLVITLPQ